MLFPNLAMRIWRSGMFIWYTCLFEGVDLRKGGMDADRLVVQALVVGVIPSGLYLKVLMNDWAKELTVSWLPSPIRLDKNLTHIGTYYLTRVCIYIYIRIYIYTHIDIVKPSLISILHAGYSKTYYKTSSLGRLRFCHAHCCTGGACSLAMLYRMRLQWDYTRADRQHTIYMGYTIDMGYTYNTWFLSENLVIISVPLKWPFHRKK